MPRVVIICDIPEAEQLAEFESQLLARFPAFQRLSPSAFEGEVSAKHRYHDLVDFFDFELAFSRPLPAGSRITRIDGDLRVTPCSCGRAP